MSYVIYLTKENDKLVVEALECLLSQTEDPEKQEQIGFALSGLHIARPYEWGLVKNVWQPNKPIKADPNGLGLAVE